MTHFGIIKSLESIFLPSPNAFNSRNWRRTQNVTAQRRPFYENELPMIDKAWEFKYYSISLWIINFISSSSLEMNKPPLAVRFWWIYLVSFLLLLSCASVNKYIDPEARSFYLLTPWSCPSHWPCLVYSSQCSHTVQCDIVYTLALLHFLLPSS